MDEKRGARPDPLDPATRHAAQLAPLEMSPSPPPPPPGGAPGGSTPPDTQARASLESLLPELVRKIAWSGDGRRGSMRIELGAGSLAGGVLLVQAEEGRVRVELDAPAGTDVGAWRSRLEERLAERGVNVEELTVR